MMDTIKAVLTLMGWGFGYMVVMLGASLVAIGALSGIAYTIKTSIEIIF